MRYEILKELRENSNYTIETMAKKLNVAKSTYCLWENGIEQIPLERLIEICDFFNISVDYLINNNKDIFYKNSTRGFNNILLANNLKNFRKELKYTQNKFANILNLGRTTIINYEKGYTIPQLDYIIFLSKKYKISADYLLGKIDNPKYLK